MAELTHIEPDDQVNGLEPHERLAWTIAIAQAFEGRSSGAATTAGLLATIKRLALELDTEHGTPPAS